MTDIRLQERLAVDKEYPTSNSEEVERLKEALATLRSQREAVDERVHRAEEEVRLVRHVCIASYRLAALPRFIQMPHPSPNSFCIFSCAEKSK